MLICVLMVYKPDNNIRTNVFYAKLWIGANFVKNHFLYSFIHLKQKRIQILHWFCYINQFSYRKSYNKALQAKENCKDCYYHFCFEG